MQFRKLFSLLIALLILLISDPILAKETNQKKSFSFEKDGTEWVSPKGIGLQREYSTAKTQQLQDLPATYDLRNLNGRSYISPVSDQGGFGTCWAFSALNSAQSNLMLKGVTDNIDFSTKALAWFAYQYQGLEGTPDDEFEGMFSLNSTFSQLESPTFDELTSIYFNGGAADTAYTQMSSWLGASTEKEIPYTNDKGTYIVDLFGSFMPDPNGDWALDYDAIYNDAYHLQNAQWIPGMRETNNVNAYVPLAKEQILENGAIALFYGSINETSPYFDDLHGSQYIPPTETNIRPNHAVTVIGWDDNYSKDAFSTPAPGNGAWIIQNSWGKTFANQGYFYLSYYDSTIEELVSYDVESPDLGYSYDNNYEYDFTDNKGKFAEEAFNQYVKNYIDQESSVSSEDLAFANVFTAKGNETLKAVSANLISGNAQVTAKVYLLNENYTSPTDGQLVATVNQNFVNAGFYTMELEQSIQLTQGQKFSVVENVIYTVSYTANNQVNTVQIPVLGLEYGLRDFVLDDMIDQTGQVVGISTLNVLTTVQPGDSYVYGVNISNQSNHTWRDVTDPVIYQELSRPINIQNADGTYTENTMLPGNCMIKAYTTDYSPDQPTKDPSEISFRNPIEYLTTDPTGVDYIDLILTVDPDTDPDVNKSIKYSIYPSSVAVISKVDPEHNFIQVNAVSEGVATVTATSVNGLTAQVKIVVSNQQCVVGSTEVSMPDQDSLSIQVNDVVSNPALASTNLDGVKVSSVSMFIWSNEDMSDAKIYTLKNLENTNNWIVEGIGINETKNYFLNANQIKYAVYVATDSFIYGGMIYTDTISWVQQGTETQGNVSYIAYNQNIGFVQPTIHSGPSGEINNPNSAHLEGFRISSGIPGVSLIINAHAANLGWLPMNFDGQYTGTMGQNRPLEAIRLTIMNSTHYSVTYRVYIKGEGWTNWVSDGEVAGTTGQAKPIQAIDIAINPINN